jgi:uncharacterized HhH-GPD family protein
VGDPNKYLEIEPTFSADGVPVPPFTNNDRANQLVGRDSNALLIGLVLDQQISMGKAFAGPYELKQRLGHINPRKIAAIPEDDFLEVIRESPAIHRYPKSMGRRVQDACRVVVEDYRGKAENIWKDQPDARAVVKRIGTVPGIGPTKLALLLLVRYYAKDIPGWREAAPIELPA